MRARRSVFPLLLSTTIIGASPAGAVTQDEILRRIERMTTIAERRCLSGQARSDTRGIRALLQGIVSGIRGGIGIERRTSLTRGASDRLPAAIQQAEQREIRQCMANFMVSIQPLIDSLNDVGGAGPTAGMPDPIDFRFNYKRTASLNRNKFGEALRFNVKADNRPISRRIVAQSAPDGSSYFQQDIRYPRAGSKVEGRITPEPFADSRLSAEQLPATLLCFRRPTRLPSRRADHDLFECEEGKTCQPSAGESTRWLDGCARTARWWQKLPLIPAAKAQDQDMRWIAPSLAALAEQPKQGVGYSIFTVATDSLRQPDVVGVEVDVHVNGTAVHEDGLPPESRPVPYSGDKRFVHNFALQTLSFQGRRDGCDLVRVALTPLLGDGRRGQGLVARLPYVALRDVAERRADADSQLSWSALYVTPAREWRHIAYVHSYTFKLDDPGQRSTVLRQISDDKKWLDGLGMIYEGARVVGVIRPPRTVKADGSAAYGLGVGIIQSTGQTRFTFSEPEARRIAAFMIARRRSSAEARRVIAPEPYIFQAVAGSRTPPSICDTIAV